MCDVMSIVLLDVLFVLHFITSIHSIGFVSIANWNDYNLIHIGSVIQYCTGKITNNKYQITRPLKIKKMRPTLPQALF